MKVYYWSPFLSEVATVKAVLNSYTVLKKNNIDVKIINCIGEWSKYKDLNLINFKRTWLFKYLPKEGYLQSRISSLIIFIVSFIELLKILKKKECDFIIIHLISSLPLFLLNFFKIKSNVILRISGKPRLNFLRKFLWKFSSKKLFKITSPTIETMNYLIQNKIFTEEKIFHLKDPVFHENEYLNLKKKDYGKKENFIAVGRLTKQKNFDFLINSFHKISKFYPKISLKIYGKGEMEGKLKKIINKNKIKNIFISGYSDNINKVFEESDCFILSSLWEDPGFVLIEAGNKEIPIISSDCPSGPKEILEHGKVGYLFKSSNYNDFKRTFDKYMNESSVDIETKVLKLKKKVYEYSSENHYKILINKIKLH